jgi:hypothetical protein
VKLDADFTEMWCPDLKSIEISGSNYKYNQRSFGYVVDSCRKNNPNADKECESEDYIDSVLGKIQLTEVIFSKRSSNDNSGEKIVVEEVKINRRNLTAGFSNKMEMYFM